MTGLTVLITPERCLRHGRQYACLACEAKTETVASPVMAFVVVERRATDATTQPHTRSRSERTGARRFAPPPLRFGPSGAPLRSLRLAASMRLKQGFRRAHALRKT